MSTFKSTTTFGGYVIVPQNCPVYAHDCSACRFLGSVESPGRGRVRDIYVCPGEGSVIFREGNLPQDYYSYPEDIFNRIKGSDDFMLTVDSMINGTSMLDVLMAKTKGRG